MKKVLFLALVSLLVPKVKAADVVNPIPPYDTRPAEVVPGCDIEVWQAEYWLFQWTNYERILNGKRPLELDTELMKQARAHTYWMMTNYSMTHSGQGWENICCGYPTAYDCVMCWLNSTDGHRENMLGDFTKFGCGIYMSPNGTVYATQRFR